MRIKFSHRYWKLGSLKTGDKVRLLQAFDIDTAKLSKEMIEWDTSYGLYAKPERYDLPQGRAIFLLFQDATGMIFQTIRRYTPEKWSYYTRNEGKEFTIVINED